MNCTEARDKLELLATGDLAADARRPVEAHLAGCPECAAILEDYRSLILRLRQTQAAEPSGPFVRSLDSAIKAEVNLARHRSRLWRVIAAGGAVAAALLIAFMFWQVADRTGRQTAHLTSHDLPSRQAPSYAVQVALKEIWQHAGVRAATVSDATAAIVRGQSIYLLLEDGGCSRVAALDAGKGTVKWRSDLESIGCLSADDRRVYCLAPAGPGLTELVALDSATGAVVWRFGQEERGRLVNPCRAVAPGDNRVCWTTNSTLHMLNGADGRAIWSRSIPNEGLLSQAVVSGDGLLVVSCNALYRLSADSGEVQLRHELSGEFSRLARPLIALSAGHVFAALRQRNGQGRVVCLDPAVGREVWSKSAPPVFHLLAADGRLFIRDQGVLALDAATGRQLWSWQAEGCGPATVADGVVYFVDAGDSGRLVAVDAASGRELWEMAGIRSCEPFLAVSRTAYLKTQDGVIRAVDIQERS